MDAAAAASYAAGSDDPVTWNSSTSEASVESAIQDDPELKQIASRLDSDVVIDPDRELNIEVSSDTSDSGLPDSFNKDSDSISTGSSLRDADENLNDDNSPSARRKKESESQSSKSVSNVSNGDHKKTHDRRKSGSIRSTSSVKSKTTSENGEKSSSSKNPLKMLKKLTKFDKPVKKTDFR